METVFSCEEREGECKCLKKENVSAKKDGV